MNIPGFVEERIRAMFDELTEKLADELAVEHGADMPSGALAFAMMAAEIYMQQKWKEYCQMKAADGIVPPDGLCCSCNVDPSVNRIDGICLICGLPRQ